MKRILTIVFLFTTVFANAQTPQDVRKQLTIQQFRDRLLPELKMLASLPLTNISLEQIAETKKKEKAIPIPELSNADSVEVIDKNIPGLNAGDPEVPIRIYKPKYLPKAPVFIWFHGGGFIAGTLNQDHQLCANISVRAGLVVISVDYRLAPENIFPAGLHDGYAALTWSSKHAGEFGGDTAHIGVGGGSAGAGITGGVVLMARDKKFPKVSLQALIFPPGDMDTTRPSVQQLYNKIPGIKGADLSVLMNIYLGKNNYKKIPNGEYEYVLPGIAKSVIGLPPTYIVTLGVDPLRDGGIAYAQRLIEAGIPTELNNYPGYPHGILPDRFYNEFYFILKQYLK